MRHNPDFARKIAHLRLELAPLYSLSRNHIHPDFPRTMLQFNLLTEAELDDLASFYDQSTPTDLTFMYPACMRWDKEFFTQVKEAQAKGKGLSAEQRMAMKRRMFGKFIGLRGMDTPMVEVETKIRWLEQRMQASIEAERTMHRKFV